MGNIRIIMPKTIATMAAIRVEALANDNISLPPYSYLLNNILPFILVLVNINFAKA